MRKMMTTYPKSVFVDDAIYETGITYVILEDEGKAIGNFKKLIQSHKNSEWVAPSYLQLGLIYFNQDNYDESLKQYKSVVSKFPKTNASSEALLAIKDVYIAKGDPNGYIKYLNNVPEANVTISEQDSILYLSAENMFTKGEYDKALNAFNEYLSRFPRGYFKLPAHFYRGESHFSFQDFDKAIGDYDVVLSNPTSRFTEKTLQRAANINYYHTKKYDLAKNQYLDLIQQATTEDNKKIAIVGLLRTNFRTKDYTSAIDYANRVLIESGFTDLQQTEAILLPG